MKHLFASFALGAALDACPAAAQDLTNAGAVLTVQPGAVLYVGTGGLSIQSGTLANAGTVRVDGPLANAGTLDLGTGGLEVRGNAANAGTLLPGTGLVTFSGAADQLLAPGGGALYRVLVNKPTAGANTLRLAGDLTVTNQLSLANGQVNTRNGAALHVLRLPAGASLSGEAPGRYVVGRLEITRAAVNGAAVDFGHGAVLDPTTNNLGAVAITRTAGLLADDESRGVNFANAAYRGIDRIWAVSPAAQPGAAVQLTLSWLPDDDNGIADFSQARAWQQAAAGQPWAGRGPAANASGRTIVLSPTSLSRFTVSNAANPLPVSLVEFAARAEGPAAVRLTWATAQELNNAGFAVERSLDGRGFAAIGTVAGAGTSSAGQEYALRDAALPAGATLLYYRLRQTDRNGEARLSPVRAVALAPHAAGFAVFPTRVPPGRAAAYLYTGPAGPGTLQVLDLLGRVVRAAPVDGGARGEVPLAGLASGAYLLRYATATARFSARCVVE
jgi:hypothetical protein